MYLAELIINFKNSKNHEISISEKTSNRINQVGDGLEAYVAELFSNALDCQKSEKEKRILNYFSFLGSKNNPPDLMIKGGPAIEVKKISSLKADLALNSSYPMSKIFADDEKITAKCREAETWLEKDMLYAIGVVKKDKLEIITFISGSLYAANNSFYKELFNDLKERILSSAGDYSNAETTELARLNKVDPLKRTHLRVRGMWIIDNPLVIFNKFIPTDFLNKKQEQPKGLFILDNEKISKNELQLLKSENITWNKVFLPDPNDPNNKLEALIFTI